MLAGAGPVIHSFKPIGTCGHNDLHQPQVVGISTESLSLEQRIKKNWGTKRAR